MSAMTQQIHGQIVKVDRLPQSTNGNPRWKVRIYKGDETIELRTKPDSYFADGNETTLDKFVGKWANIDVNGRNQITNFEFED